MSRYLVYRFLHAIFVLWGAYTLSFLLLQVLPGDAVLVRFQDPELGLSPAQIADIRLAYGADDGVMVQYWHALSNIVRGRLGQSLGMGVPVATLLKTTLPVTLRLSFCSILIAVMLMLVGSYGALLFPVYTRMGKIVRSIPPILHSFPVFWLSILVIQIISFKLRLVSIITVSDWGQIVLPALTLGCYLSAALVRVMVSSQDRVYTQPLYQILHARGFSLPRVWAMHLLPNAIAPVITQTGMLFGELLAGAIVTETIFGLNGLGRLAGQAVANQDVAVMQSIIILTAIVFVIVTFLVEIILFRLDVRNRAFLPKRKTA